MKAFCVHIPSETARRKHCEIQYEEAGIEYEFVEAVDGRLKEIHRPVPKSDVEAARWASIDAAALSLGSSTGP